MSRKPAVLKKRRLRNSWTKFSIGLNLLRVEWTQKHVDCPTTLRFCSHWSYSLSSWSHSAFHPLSSTIRTQRSDRHDHDLRPTRNSKWRRLDARTVDVNWATERVCANVCGIYIWTWGALEHRIVRWVVGSPYKPARIGDKTYDGIHRIIVNSPIPEVFYGAVSPDLRTACVPSISHPESTRR
jgi:hypothetical protein